MYNYNEENRTYYEQANDLGSQDAGYSEIPEQKAADTSPKPKSSFRKKMTRCVAYALAFGVVAGTAFEGSSYAMNQLFGDKGEKTVASTEKSGSSKDTLPTTSVATGDIKNISSIDVSQIVDEVMPSIVAITNMSEIPHQYFFGYYLNEESESAGSGIIVGEDDNYLYIATNNHVVQRANSLTVQFNDDTTASAEIQGTDATNDLAVVKVLKSDMEDGALNNVKVAALGDSTGLSVGEAAIAIGNALGYGQSVTTGVVSALDRLVSIQDETTGQTVSSRLIQTDAAINPGNSGGALLNAKGEVIGINSSKYSDTDVEGMGFAIPVSTAKPIIDELVATGKSTASQGAYLGILGVDVSTKESQAYNFPIGVYITQVVENSAAANAGLSQGDIITKIDNTTVKTFEELKSVVSGHRAGDVVTLTYHRRGETGEYEENTMNVTLGEYPQEADTEDETSEETGDTRRGREDYDGSGWDNLPDSLFPGLWD